MIQTLLRNNMNLFLEKPTKEARRVIKQGRVKLLKQKKQDIGSLVTHVGGHE